MAATCSNCAAELVPDARFCSACGTAVATAASIVPPAPRAVADYTPKHLADKILQSRSALEGESKQVTVMFADVKGSMELAHQLGAEGWHEVLDQFFGILGDGIHRYEGTVNQYTGDGIMALFGAPIAHEDHAQRACYAGVHLRGELKDFADRLRIERGVDFGVRIGINSGEVVVGKIGDDLRMDYTAQGHTVGLAQRIEQLAAAGQAYISDNTKRLVEGFFELRDLGASRLSGAVDPVRIFELGSPTQSSTRLQVARERGLTQFVGRASEMQTLESAFEHACQGHGQVVGVVGDPGLGKSRLCYEFVEKRKSEGIKVIEGHCPAHGKNIPLIPILELWRSFFGITPQDSAEQSRQKIAGSLVLLDPALQKNLPVLFDFIGVADPLAPSLALDSETRQRELFILMRELCRTLADRGLPAVIYIDDMHWIDPTSDLFVAQMVEAVAENSRILLLLNFRPEYSAAWMRRSHYQQLPLVPLGEQAIKELVESLLGKNTSVEDLAERIMRWTSGNPFYTEEIISELIESEHLLGAPGDYRLVTAIEKLEVPANVRAVLAARIDRLSENEKFLLQAASVVGKEFSGPIIETVTELSSATLSTALDQLKSRDFIFETAIHPHLAYSFKHPLTQEVAYASMLHNRKEKFHASVALAIEQGSQDKLDELSPLIAHHWDTANEPTQAIVWHRRAGEWSATGDALGGMHHWSRVRELAMQLPAEKHTLELGALACSNMIAFRWRIGSSRDDVDKDFETGKKLAEQSGNNAILAALYGGYSGCLGVSFGEANLYGKYADEAAYFANMADDEELKYAIDIYVQAARWWSGKFQLVQDNTDDIDNLLNRDSNYGARYIGSSPKMYFLVVLGGALANLGNYEESVRTLNLMEGFGTAKEHGEVALFGHLYRLQNALLYGDEEQALSATRTLAMQGELSKTNLSRMLVSVGTGLSNASNGRYAEALACFGFCRELETEKNTGGGVRPTVLAGRSSTHLAMGNIEAALQDAIDVVEYCRPRELRFDLHPWLALVNARISSGAQDLALEAIAETQGVINDTGAVVYQPHLHECRAQFAEKFGSTWNQRDEWNEALRLFHELGAINHVKRIQSRAEEF